MKNPNFSGCETGVKTRVCRLEASKCWGPHLPQVLRQGPVISIQVVTKPALYDFDIMSSR